MMNISILASIGCQNLGDELILKNEITLLEGKFSGKKINFKVFSYIPKDNFFEKENVEYLEYFPINSKKVSNILKNIKNLLLFIKTIFLSDLVVIGGGGIIYDNELQSVKNPLKLWLFRVRVARFFRKKILFYGVGIDVGERVKSEEGRVKSEGQPLPGGEIMNLKDIGGSLLLVKKIFSFCDEISVRDENSQNLLKQLDIKSEIILDPVFSDNNPGEQYSFTKSFCLKKIDSKSFNISNLKGVDFSGKKVGIAFRKGYFNNARPKMQDTKFEEKLEIGKFIELINFIFELGAKQITLLPHSFHKSDAIANDYDFYVSLIDEIEKMGKKNLAKITICEDIEQTYKVYKDKKIDICLSQRLHSMILSQVYCIPFIGFSYGAKTEELLKKV